MHCELNLHNKTNIQLWTYFEEPVNLDDAHCSLVLCDPVCDIRTSFRGKRNSRYGVPQVSRPNLLGHGKTYSGLTAELRIPVITGLAAE